ncbi:hypothetical protein HYH03_018250 [Edaphochlamys debaryana]|uniref:Uncharacterized protein n=1 Tax=Edaphochlamys debaryana TaxID=47281 RepID=A0A836BNB5_9CHLO|nr:hypothetical protein HYH03_018250 [Edaphochlamys debaryana]|eukprot:KAG2482860.1 hypothetical protein HYH03_018250 [Edaphochlamys debaryana]
MDAFTGVVKAALLLEDVPRKAAAQMVQLAATHMGGTEGPAAPLLAAAQDPIFTSASMMAYLQRIFRASMPRIAQVLELVVGPALSVADSCDGVALAGLLEVLPAGQGDTDTSEGFASESDQSPAMGMFGMTRRQVYVFLRHRETIRQWGILGFLVFPEIMRHPGSPQRLTQLLADGFALHVYKDRVACAHALALQHLGPAIVAALGAGGAPSSGGGASPRGLGALLGRFSTKLRKSQTEEQDAHEGLPPHPLLVAAAATAVAAAPLQHRMWRTYLSGQLRGMHAAFAACPTRIPGQMDMLMAALSLGREELLWYFRHQGCSVPPELAPLLAAKGLLPGAQGRAGAGQAQGQVPVGSSEDALQALQLLAAMDAMHRLLAEHHSSLSKMIRDAVGADMQAHVVPCTPRVEFRLRQAQTNGAPGAAPPGLQPFKEMTDLLRSVLLASSPPADAAARVASAAGIWVYVSLQLAAVEPPLKAAKVLQYAEDTHYLDILQKSLDAARLLYEGPLLHAASADLAPGLSHLLETLLAAAGAALGSSRLECVHAALGAMQGLHWMLPNRVEAYAAAVAGSGPGSRRTSQDMSSSAPSRNSSSAGGPPSQTPRAANSRRLQNGQPDDLPQRCLGLVVGCVRQLLAPVVQAPLASSGGLDSSASTAGATASSGSLRGRHSSHSIIKAAAARMGRTSDNSAATSSRGTTPERLRADGSGHRSAAEAQTEPAALLPGQGSGEAPRGLEDAHDSPAGEAGRALPAAAELAARLLPLCLALDCGRMLLVDSVAGSSSSSSGGGGGGGVAEALELCRGQLVEAVRDSFTQLLANTAAAIGQASLPVPSAQLAPLRRFVEVVSALQPHLATELLPELAAALLQQSSAPTLQTIGLEAAAVSRPRLPPPPATTVEVALSVNPKAGLVPAGRSGSITSGASFSGAGPMSRSFTGQGQNGRYSSAGGDSDRSSLGPMTAALVSSGGAGSPSGPSVLRAMHAWLWSTVVNDDRRMGVAYDTEAGAFAAPSAPGLAAATSVRELALLFEWFGPCAAADLTRGCDQLIHSTLEQMQAALEFNARPLQELLDAARTPLDQRLAAVQRALPCLAPPAPSAAASGSGPAALLGPLAEMVLRLGRCLALRLQLGRAAAVAASRSADFAALALSEMAGGGTGGEAGAEGRREWAALVRLGAGAVGEAGGDPGALLPHRDDPLLTAIVTAMLPSLEAAQRWHRLPALLAALMAAPQWSSAPPGASAGPAASRSGGGRSRSGSVTGAAPGGGGSTGGAWSALPGGGPQAVAVLGLVSTVAVSLALSLQAAMAQALHPSASQFLLGCASPAGAMLCAYQRTALAALQASASASHGGPSSASLAPKQAALVALEQLPLLRAYRYSPLDTEPLPAPDPGDCATPTNASLELGGGSWWAVGSGAAGGGAGGGTPRRRAAAVAVEADPSEREPALVGGRWSGGVDAWRPAARLAPLVMGQVG